MAVHYAIGVEYRCNLIYADARDLAESLTGPGDTCQVPIILAAVAYECFLNELAYTFANPIPGSSLADEAASSAAALVRLEEERCSPLDKTRSVYKALTGDELSKGEGPYPDLAELFRLRDALVHSKPATFDMARAQNGANFEIVAAMSARKLIPHGSESSPFVWTRHVLTPSVAKWAFDTSRDRAVWLTERFPAPSRERDLMLDLLTRFPVFGS